MKIENDEQYQEVCEACAEYAFNKLDDMGDYLKSKNDLLHYLRGNLAFLDVENLLVIFLDVKLKILKSEIVAKGTIDKSAIYPREILKRVIECGAKSVIFAHNHPSGGVEPSYRDKEFTTKMQEALRYFDVDVVEHIIITRYEYFSFCEYGLLKK